jgi:hypothetical protein
MTALLGFAPARSAAHLPATTGMPTLRPRSLSENKPAASAKVSVPSGHQFSLHSEFPLRSKIGEIFLPEFGGSANSRRSCLLFQLAQLHPADLTGDSLR